MFIFAYCYRLTISFNYKNITMNAIDIITGVLFLVPFFILWLLSDTITEFLSDGKSFANNETKFY